MTMIRKRQYRVGYTGLNIPGTAQAVTGVFAKHEINIVRSLLGEVNNYFEVHPHRAVFKVERHAEGSLNPEEDAVHEHQFRRDLASEIHDAIDAHYTSLGFAFLSEERQSVKVAVTVACPGSGLQLSCQVWANDHCGIEDAILKHMWNVDNPADQPLNVESMYCMPVYAGNEYGGRALMEFKCSIKDRWPHWDDLSHDEREQLAYSLSEWLVKKVSAVRGVTDISCKCTNPDIAAHVWNLPLGK